MPKKKLQFFAENRYFDNLFDRCEDKVFLDGIKGYWLKKIFRNSNSICLELACGKGEYTVALAKQFPNTNYIGIDIKGDRLNRGAKQAKENKLKNVVFLRIQIEHLYQYFSKDEINEIWIPFPDPHLSSSRTKKRLTSPRFLQLYRKIAKEGSILHLKTDSTVLYDYTLKVFQREKMLLIESDADIYAKPNKNNQLIKIQTSYEKSYLRKNLKIKYIKSTLA